jgi:sugar transferase EpsL
MGSTSRPSTGEIGDEMETPIETPTETPIETSDDTPALVTHIGSPGSWWRGRSGWWLKRAFDLSASVVGLLLLSPLLACVALAIRIQMGAPVLFRQERPGYKGAPFVLRKFRTMRDVAEGEVWFRSDTERVTWLGRFLRRSSIDELPELLNVIRGEMSLVGPRPLLMEYLEKYTPEEMRRHDTPPGITGWAQVNGRQNIPFSERFRLDVWYVENWRMALDLKILFRTFYDVFKRSDVVVGQNVDDVDDLGLSADRERAANPEQGESE